MMDMELILKKAVQQSASDIFIVAGAAVSYKIFGDITEAEDERLTPVRSNELIMQIYRLAGIDFPEGGVRDETDFSFSFAGVGRFRVNVYRQRSTAAAVLRNVLFDLPDYAALNIPEEIMGLTRNQNGIILVTGAAGSGKSTTLTCMIDRINSTQRKHIVTIEDPIEFLHKHKQSIISQREISIDTRSYAAALRAALRQSPDVILLGEMRDNETMSIAMTAAETGQLVLSTIHTIGAVNTIDRIIDIFPTIQQHQIRMQLSMVLKAVVSQQLIPSADGGLLPAFEILTVNNAVQTMIREQKTHQIETVMQTSKGMVTMDTSIFTLLKEGQITREKAVLHASNPEMMKKKIELLDSGRTV